MGFVKDFKAFAMKGSVVDLAVGVVIGGAFGKIVKAFVADIIMPLVSVFTGNGPAFTDKFIVLKAGKEGDVYTTLAEATKAGANVLAYGDLIQTIVDFLIIALFIFIVISYMAKVKKKEEAAPPPPPPGPTDTEKLLMEIRDELKKNNS